jgi:cation diffusion facilitator family transporter
MPLTRKLNDVTGLKSFVALLSVVTTSTLTFLKLLIGLLSGSVSVLAEGFHSATDMLAAFVAFVSVKKSSLPPDDDHPYGHGKFESISGALEASLILGATFYVLYEAIKSLVEGRHISYGLLAIFVMSFSALANWVISSILLSVAKKTDSLALEADGWHLRIDAYTSTGAIVALLLVFLTGFRFWDSITALIIAGVMAHTGLKLFASAWHQLTDASLSPSEIKLIDDLIKTHAGELVSYHKMRSRRAGSYRYVDLHMVVKGSMSVEEAHKICDELENEVRNALPNTELLIHIEPSEEAKAESRIRPPSEPTQSSASGLLQPSVSDSSQPRTSDSSRCKRFRWGYGWRKRR